MPDTTDADSRATRAAGAGGASGCVIFLIDEQAAMDARTAAGTKSKAATIATALNSLLKRLCVAPALDVAIVGYRAAPQGVEDIGPRWGGDLAGRQFVSTSELARSPLTVETRTRKLPGAGGVGTTREESVQFPVWYTPSLGGTASRAAAFEHCRRMFSTWLSAAGPECKPPMLVSCLGELTAQESPDVLGKVVQDLPTHGGPPLVLHAHLSTSDRVPATLYPSSAVLLPPGPVRTLFQASSVLPEEFCRSLGQLQVTVNPGARGLIYNARMVDLIRLLSLVETYTQYQPQAQAAPPSPEAAPTPGAKTPLTDSPTVQVPAPDGPTVQTPSADVESAGALSEPVPGREVPAEVESPSRSQTEPPSQTTDDAPTPSAADAGPPAAEQRALVVLLLDRSVEDPTGKEEKTVWRRLEAQANELLGEISRRGQGRIDCALVCYGTNASGRPEVATTFSGPLAERTVVGDADLAGGAVRVEEVIEQVSNGIGGLVSVTRKRPVFVDLKPTAAAAPLPAFAAVGELSAQWRKDHAGSRVAPIVLHVTRGQFTAEQIEQAVGRLRETGRFTLYHLVLTEAPHPSVAYPHEPTKIEDNRLVKLWELTSPLSGSQVLAARKRAVAPHSRGIVINGRFDLFWDAVEEAFVAAQAAPSGAT